MDDFSVHRYCFCRADFHAGSALGTLVLIDHSDVVIVQGDRFRRALVHAGSASCTFLFVYCYGHIYLLVLCLYNRSNAKCIVQSDYQVGVINTFRLDALIASPHIPKVYIENREFSPLSISIIAPPAVFVVRETDYNVAVACPCKQGEILLRWSDIRCRMAMH